MKRKMNYQKTNNLEIRKREQTRIFRKSATCAFLLHAKCLKIWPPGIQLLVSHLVNNLSLPLSLFVPFYLPIAAPFVYLKNENSNYLALGGVLTQPLRLLARATTRKTPWLVCSVQDLDNYLNLFLLFFLICLGFYPQLGANGGLLCQALRPQRIELLRSSRFVLSVVYHSPHFVILCSASKSRTRH